MRFLCLFRPDTNAAPPSPEHAAKIGQYIERSYASGVLLATEGFQPSPKDVRVRYVNGEFSVTDGPFTEAKELIGGYAILQCSSRQAAIDNCKEFLQVVGSGESEIHELPETAR